MGIKYVHTKSAGQRPLKQSVSVRLDPEIVAYFRDQGAGWQTRMNDALLDLIEAHKSPPISKEAGDVDGPAPDA